MTLPRTPEQQRDDTLAARRRLFEPRAPPVFVPVGPLPPRRAHCQVTPGRRPGEPGGDLGTIAWEEHVEACRARGRDPVREAAAGGMTWGEVVAGLGREPGTWARWV